MRHDLFSVLGTVSEFRSGESILNRADFAKWLTQHEETLKLRVGSWIPSELSKGDRDDLLQEMREDCLTAVDGAIQSGPGDHGADGESNRDDGTGTEDAPEQGEERAQQSWNSGKLLDRFLYCGILPRYAFPTDVATFHVFDQARSTSFRPIMRFGPVPGVVSCFIAICARKAGLDFRKVLYVRCRLLSHAGRRDLKRGPRSASTWNVLSAGSPGRLRLQR